MHYHAIDIRNKSERGEIIKFLQKLGLGYEKDIEYTIALLDDSKIISTPESGNIFFITWL
ncbi:unnamed protein product [marine sediment metagenome]|uniref:Uncharacterized protein n=1 Tax=marine sediment metagenome TaxID=412755 RepID=X1VC25_9ZZZZ